MQFKNIFYDIKMPLKEILDMINWCCTKSKELEEKFGDNYVHNSFKPLYSDKLFDGIFKIEDWGDKFMVKGFYKTTWRSVSHDTHGDKNDEGWHTEEGDFEEHLSTYVPKELFDKTHDEVFDILVTHYDAEFKKMIQDKRENLVDQIVELQMELKEFDEKNKP